MGRFRPTLPDPRERAAASWRLPLLQDATPRKFLTIIERLERLERRLARLEERLEERDP